LTVDLDLFTAHRDHPIRSDENATGDGPIRPAGAHAQQAGLAAAVPVI
jgi:hypothetical protein